MPSATIHNFVEMAVATGAEYLVPDISLYTLNHIIHNGSMKHMKLTGRFVPTSGGYVKYSTKEGRRPGESSSKNIPEPYPQPTRAEVARRTRDGSHD